MKRKQLESYLEEVNQFSSPKLELEQYATDSHLAASVLYTMESSFGDLQDKIVLDLGAGCGVLSIGRCVNFVSVEVEEVVRFYFHLQLISVWNLSLVTTLDRTQ